MIKRRLILTCPHDGNAKNNSDDSKATHCFLAEMHVAFVGELSSCLFSKAGLEMQEIWLLVVSDRLKYYHEGELPD